ncbi:MAG: prolipoprotein diacylglyceryl transferase [Dethiobacter sp.]|nr:prolipoprotein diacylglyceryl transferase [Dethiobacter sp.]
MNPVAFQIFGLPVYWYGVMISTGLLLAFLVTLTRTEKYGFDADQLVNFLLFAVPAALIGTRIGYVVAHWDEFSGNLVSVFAVRQGGLAIHGGIFAAILTGVIFARATRVKFWRLADLCAPGLILGQAIGRWGNYFNQEAYGVETGVPWAMYIAGAMRHPTFLYESLWNFMVFLYLLWVSGRERTDGGIFIRYLIWYSAGRFVIEGLRTDSAMIGGFRTAQLLSLVLIHGGLILLWWLKKQNKERLGRYL